jgi:hypothetical protein
MTEFFEGVRTVPKTTRRSTIHRLGWLGALPAVVAVLLLLAPAVAGVSAASTVLKAPFTSATVTLSNPATRAGTGVTLLVTKSFFNKTTGVGGFSDNGSATWKSTSSNNSALAAGRIEVSLPVTISTTGRHTITVVWVTIATGSVNLTAGTCHGNASLASSSCTRFAQAFVHGFGNLVDRTNGSILRVQTWPGNFTSVWSNTTCARLTCTTSASTGHAGVLHTGTAFWSWTWSSVALNASHKYVLQMFLFDGAQVTLETSGATLRNASGNAQLNSATNGNDETLKTVTIA